jgi:hypothetical protein
MVFLRFTYNVVRGNFRDEEPYQYLLLDAEPVAHGGVWALYDLNGNFICE